MFDKRKEAAPQPTPEAPVPDATPRRKVRAASPASVIGASIKIHGNIEGDENLVIEGQVDGSISLAKAELVIGASGTAMANLLAKSVRIDGSVTGDVLGSALVTVTTTGKVYGDITAPRVTLEDGAKFKGSIDMDPGSTTKSDVAAKAKTSTAVDPGNGPQEASA